MTDDRQTDHATEKWVAVGGIACAAKAITSDNMCSCKYISFRWTADLPKLHAGLEAGPLLIFDKFGSVLVISAFDNFMSASYEHDAMNATVSWGIMGRVNSVPKRFQYSTIMYYSARGINKVLYSVCYAS